MPVRAGLRPARDAWSCSPLGGARSASVHARVDLPGEPDDAAASWSTTSPGSSASNGFDPLIAGRLHRRRAPGRGRHESLLRSTAARDGVEVVEALRADGARWWSSPATTGVLPGRRARRTTSSTSRRRGRPTAGRCSGTGASSPSRDVAGDRVRPARDAAACGDAWSRPPGARAGAIGALRLATAAGGPERWSGEPASSSCGRAVDRRGRRGARPAAARSRRGPRPRLVRDDARNAGEHFDAVARRRARAAPDDLMAGRPRAGRVRRLAVRPRRARLRVAADRVLAVAPGTPMRARLRSLLDRSVDPSVWRPSRPGGSRVRECRAGVPAPSDGRLDRWLPLTASAARRQDAAWARRSSAGLHPRGPHAVPREGPAVPRRVRADAARVALRRRAPDDRHRDRAQPRRRAQRPRACGTPRCSRRSPTPTSRPSSASSTSRSTWRRAGCRRRAVRRSRTSIRDSLNAAEAKARQVGAHMVMVGILPTLPAEHMQPEHAVGQPALPAAQRPDLRRPRRGHRDRHRRRRAAARSPPTRSCPRPPAPRCSCTCRSAPTTSRRTGTPRRRSPASSSRSAPTRRSCSARSCGTRPGSPLFEQATDTRSEELKAQGVRPRVWFGERWITSIFDLFEENVRYFPALLPIVDDEDPVAVLDGGDTPQLGELRLHNGTIYRWNRPVYDVVRGCPHLRVENRVLPAGPDRRRHDGQRRLLLRPGARAGRRRAAAVVADVVQRGRGELPRRRARRHRRARCTGPGIGTVPAHRAGAAPAAARARTRGSTRGASTPPSATGCSASSSSAA